MPPLAAPRLLRSLRGRGLPQIARSARDGGDYVATSAIVRAVMGSMTYEIDAATHGVRAAVVVLALAPAIVIGSVRRAEACGASVGGAAGLSACSLEAHEEETRPKAHASVIASYTSTVLHFSGDRRAEQARFVGLGALELRPTRTFSVLFGAGPIAGGHLDTGGARYDISPGFAGAAAASWRVLDAAGARPFVLLGGQITGVATTTHPTGPDTAGTGYEALDVRIGATAGWIVTTWFAPYAVARTFGGPIAWRVDGEAVSGTDAYHYQLGAGASFLIGRSVDVFVEGVPLGEQGASLGIGATL